jgi:lysophospholipase L1-like esterase
VARRWAYLLAALLLVALLLLLAGCGEEDDPPAPEENAPTQAPSAGHEEAPKQRVTLRGGERLLFFGDSLSVQGEPTFADRLPAALESRAPGVTVENVSVSGTTSEDWRPGADLFEGELEPRLEGADVVLVSVGGNDLEAALGAADGLDALSPADASTAAAGLRGALRRLRRNLRATFKAIRAANPRAAIVYVGYPDYSRSEDWRDAAGSIGTIALRAGLDLLVAVSRDAGPDAVVDMTAATRAKDVDALLADGEHLSARGHALYAREIAAALTR